ncbi:MAG TPA: DNA polymerase III subunit alpha [Chloroflexota bacterium]|jgi:error-prone DNA polymerase|nr:DNA polymerase III subunit alpha [Chloroflexota bacterium]
MGLSPEPPFTHLHVHSNFSFLDGATPPERLLERAAELSMPTLALTDHHGLYGAVRFMQAAAAYGVKPIIGVEVEVQDSARSHLTLLAKNRAGYAALCRIVTRAQLDHQDDPHIALDDIAPLAREIVALSGCPRGQVPAALPRSGSNLDAAVATAGRYAEIFGRENFWIELEHHLLPGDNTRNQQLVEVARQAGLGHVITNNVHYARPEEYRLRDVMACIQTNTTLDGWTDIRHRNGEYYLKTAGQLRQAFRSLPKAAVDAGLAASGEIASRCDLSGDAVLAAVTRAPAFAVPEGETPFSFLYALCDEGLRRRYQPMTPEAVNRLAYELNVVEQMDLSEFFLCVWDMVRFSKERGIRCAGRGSAADSIIAYVLGITTVDPLANNLLFDRFLNPGRVGMPDVDIDFDSRRRDEVIEYVENKYGPEHSAMVANLITYRSRSAFRDVAKAMGYPPGLIDHIASSLSYRSVNRIREDLQAAGIEAPDADQAKGRGVLHTPAVDHANGNSNSKSQSFGQLETIIALCEQLDGYPRHLSLHNGGMLITREPLVDIVPIEYATSGVRVCQFNKDDVESLGLIKFDILGLRTLSIVDEAVAMIKEARGLDLPIDDLRLDDPVVYDFICTSKTIGVFQIESPGQWNLLQRAQPRTFGDLIIQIALFRPGPLQGGMVDPYIERRCGREPVSYMHESLEDALRDTLGVVIFQEQVLQVAHDFAGLSYAEADGLRRAMSHYRTEAEMDVCRTSFVESAVRLGRDRALAEEMYHKITYFSGYGFCRSHAAAFAKTVYQTAFLKTYFPAELLAGILSNEPCCYYPTQTVIEDARKWGIEVLPVDVNRSRTRYHVEARRRDFERLGTSGKQRKTPPAHADRPSTFNLQPSTILHNRTPRRAGQSYPFDMRAAQAYKNERGTIRMGFLQVKGLSEDAAETITAVRKSSPFRSLADFWRRTSIDRNALQNLIAVGAFDSLGAPRRALLWQMEEVIKTTPRLQKLSTNPISFVSNPTSNTAASRFRNETVSSIGAWGNARVSGSGVGALENAHGSISKTLGGCGIPRHTLALQASLGLETEPWNGEPVPDLPAPTELDLAGLDMTLQNASARYSVMSFYRRSLKAARIMTIGEVQTKPHGLVLKTAGIVISRQQPPTAKGMTFLVLSDEEGELPAAVPPHIYAQCRRTLSSSASLVVEGTLQRYRRYVSLMIKRMWDLREVATLDTEPYHDQRLQPEEAQIIA